MGMFDTVYLTCPHCNEEIDCQTKSGECMLNSYTIDNMPMSIPSAMLGFNHCYRCQKAFEVEMVTKPTYRVIKGTYDESK